MVDFANANLLFSIATQKSLIVRQLDFQNASPRPEAGSSYVHQASQTCLQRYREQCPSFEAKPKFVCLKGGRKHMVWYYIPEISGPWFPQIEKCSICVYKHWHSHSLLSLWSFNLCWKRISYFRSVTKFGATISYKRFGTTTPIFSDRCRQDSIEQSCTLPFFANRTFNGYIRLSLCLACALSYQFCTG